MELFYQDSDLLPQPVFCSVLLLNYVKNIWHRPTPGVLQYHAVLFSLCCALRQQRL